MPMRDDYSLKPGTTIPTHDRRPFLVRFQFPLRIVWFSGFAAIAAVAWPHVVAWDNGISTGANLPRTSQFVIYSGANDRVVTRPRFGTKPSGLDLITSVEYGMSGDPSRVLPAGEISRLLRLCTREMYRRDEMCQRAAISSPPDIMRQNLPLVQRAMQARLPSAYWYARETAIRTYLLGDCMLHWWRHIDDFECRSARIGDQFAIAETRLTQAKLVYASDS